MAKVMHLRLAVQHLRAAGMEDLANELQNRVRAERDAPAGEKLQRFEAEMKERHEAQIGEIHEHLEHAMRETHEKLEHALHETQQKLEHALHDVHMRMEELQHGVESAHETLGHFDRMFGELIEEVFRLIKIFFDMR